MRRRPPSGEALDDALARELHRELHAADTDTASYLAKRPLIRARATKAQLGVVLDPSKRKAARCPRRAGKTTTAQLLIADYFAEHAEKVAWYIATTLKSARKLLWNPLKRLNRELSLGITFHKTDATARWPNGDELWLAGADDERSINELLGHAPSIAVIDECGSFAPDDIEYLIEDVVEPSLLDEDGTLLLVSTPGLYLHGKFYDITGPNGAQPVQTDEGKHVLARPFRERRQPQWKGVSFEYSLHTWTLKENTARPDLWQKALALKKRKGWSDQNPVWRRQYLGEWVQVGANRVFLYDAAEHTWSPGAAHDRNPRGLPEEHSWRFLIGIDLGAYDPFAIQVAAFSPSSPLLLQCYEWEADVDAKLSVGEMATAINQAAEACGGWGLVEEVIGDHEGLGDNILSTLHEEHGIWIEPADKKNKLDHIQQTNGELKDGRCKVMKDSRLAREMALLHWDPKRPGKYKSGVPNNNTDAFLYLSTRARDRNSIDPSRAPTEAERRAELERQTVEKYMAAKRRREQRDAPSLEIRWQESKGWR